MGKYLNRHEMNPRTILFCHRYVLCNNETQAASEAYPKLTRESAANKGYTLLKNPAVKKYIAKLQEEIHGSKEQVTDKAKQVLDELDLVGFSDIRVFFPEGTEERKFLDRAGISARAVESIEITENRYGVGPDVRVEKNTKFKLHNKMKALELRGKNLKLYTDLIQGVVITKPEVYVPDNGRNRPANEPG